MSKLDELIQEYCPDGVEYKKVIAVCSISKGIQFNKKDMHEIGSYPVINGGLLPSGYIEQYNQEENVITISQGGASAGYVSWQNKKFWAGAHCFIIKGLDNIVNRYLYHFLKMNEYKLQECQYGAGIPALSKSVIENLSIPLPQLLVQEEIVRILDNFTELIENLNNELTARKKQYEYYRDKLLTFDVLFGGTNAVKWELLGESCYMKAGKAISSSLICEHDSTHLIKCYGGNGIRGYVQEANETGPCSIIGRQGALCGNVKFVMGDFYATEHAVVVKSKGEYDEKFLYYILTYMNLNQYKSAGAQPGLSVKRISELLAPIPSLETQKRIVQVLDNFEKICSDLNIGLPAEIEARQKQYEYYRDALLTFAAKGDIIVNRTEQNRTEHQYELIKLIQYVFGFVSVKLKDIADIKRGIRVVKSQLSETGKYAVYQNSMQPLGYYNKSNCSGNTAFIITAGAAGEVGYSYNDFWAADDCMFFDCSEILNSRYLFFVLCSQQDYLSTKVRRASVPRLSRANIENIKIPLPPLAEQERIVAVLDRFYALCNDLTCGLPAEIAARQKQYEYYRDKLLTFKEAK